MDPKLAMHQVLQQSPLCVKFLKVDGNQDEKPNFNYNIASRLVKRNIDMDEQAKHFLRDPPEFYQPTENVLSFPGQKVSFKLEGKTVTGSVQERVLFQQHATALKQRK